MPVQYAPDLSKLQKTNQNGHYGSVTTMEPDKIGDDEINEAHVNEHQWIWNDNSSVAIYLKDSQGHEKPISIYTDPIGMPIDYSIYEKSIPDSKNPNEKDYFKADPKDDKLIKADATEVIDEITPLSTNSSNTSKNNGSKPTNNKPNPSNKHNSRPANNKPNPSNNSNKSGSSDNNTKPSRSASASNGNPASPSSSSQSSSNTVQPNVSPSSDSDMNWPNYDDYAQNNARQLAFSNWLRSRNAIRDQYINSIAANNLARTNHQPFSNSIDSSTSDSVIDNSNTVDNSSNQATNSDSVKSQNTSRSKNTGNNVIPLNHQYSPNMNTFQSSHTSQGQVASPVSYSQHQNTNNQQVSSVRENDSTTDYSSMFSNSFKNESTPVISNSSSDTKLPQTNEQSNSYLLALGLIMLGLSLAGFDYRKHLEY